MGKMRATTALSIAGVLAAGGAAYALNVNVLGPSGAPRTSIALQNAALTTDSTVMPADGSVAATELSRTATTVTYQVGEAGTVMIDISNGQVTVSSVVPNSGWTAEPARADGVGSVKVHFVSGTTRLEFVASMVDGTPTVSVALDNAPGSGISSTKPTMPGSSVGHDDDDDDGEHEGEHRGDDDEDHEDGPEFEHEDDD
jgi:ABC-type Zn2+ transport system substrate-binding protein/surface adhesin